MKWKEFQDSLKELITLIWIYKLVYCYCFLVLSLYSYWMCICLCAEVKEQLGVLRSSGGATSVLNQSLKSHFHHQFSYQPRTTELWFSSDLQPNGNWNVVFLKNIIMIMIVLCLFIVSTKRFSLFTSNFKMWLEVDEFSAMDTKPPTNICSPHLNRDWCYVYNVCRLYHHSPAVHIACCDRNTNRHSFKELRSTYGSEKLLLVCILISNYIS